MKISKSKIILIIAAIFFFSPLFWRGTGGEVFAQSVGINTTGIAANSSALLDIDASPGNNKGILFPRIPLTATNSGSPISPAPGAGETGLMVYNTATAGISPNNVVPGFYYWNGSAWMPISGGATGGGWTDDGTVVRLITSNDFVGIGTATPASKLDVEGGISIGATYSGTTAAPANGAIIEGNVGIGTTNPGYKLDVAGSARISATSTSLTLGANNTTQTYIKSGGYAYLGQNNQGSPGAFISAHSFPDSPTTFWATGNSPTIIQAGYDAIDFYGSNGAAANSSFTPISRMHITPTTGNVGIGTTTPGTTLDVNGIINAATGYRVANAATSGNYL